MSKSARAYGIEYRLVSEETKGEKIWHCFPPNGLELFQGVGDGQAAEALKVYSASLNKAWLCWQTGKDAARQVEELTARFSGFLAQVRVTPIPSGALIFNHTEGNGQEPGAYWQAKQVWTKREKARFESGDYIALPWFGNDSKFTNIYTRPRMIPAHDKLNHFAHVSQSDNRRIAYTETSEKGVLDRQTITSPGKYLTKFARAYGLDSAEIAELTAKYALKYGDAEGPPGFAFTADDIEYVYEHGPSSCMGHDATAFKNDFHPCRVYAAGDLAIAYLQEDDDSDSDDAPIPAPDKPKELGAGRITARTLVWPEKKVYGRIYGDAVRLKYKLESSGFTGAGEYEFDGARLLKIPVKGRSDMYHGPYLDCADGRVRMGKDFFYVDYRSGECAMRETGGCFSAHDNMVECTECGDNLDAGECSRLHGEYYCQDCYDSVSCSCPDCEESYHADHVTFIATYDGATGEHNESVCRDCAEGSGYALCVQDDRLYNVSGMQWVIDRNGNENRIANHNLEESGAFQCAFIGSYYVADCLGGYWNGQAYSLESIGSWEYLEAFEDNPEAFETIAQIRLNEENAALQVPLILPEPGQVIVSVNSPLTPLLLNPSGLLEPCIPAMVPNWQPIERTDSLRSLVIVYE